MKEYESLGSEIFDHPRRLHIHNKLWLASKYDWRRMEKLMKETIEKYKKPEEADNVGFSRFAQSVPEKGVHHCKT